MQHRQRGMTMLGIILVVAVVGAWLYVGIRLTPLYLEYMRTHRHSKGPRRIGATRHYGIHLRKGVERQFDIEWSR